MTHTSADAAIWAAQLADMPKEVIVDWLIAQGHGDLARMLHGRITGALEPDDEEGVIAVFLRGTPLPFDAERDM